MAKRILVVYYTQTGQLKNIVDSICNPLVSIGSEVIYEELKPIKPFPFPWTSDQFFQAMPESVRGIPCELEPLKVRSDEHFDLVIIAWQPWYLSPSIPVHAFFQNETALRLLKGKPVITIIGSRNMWVSAQIVIKEYLNKAGAYLKGNIVLYDRTPNLVSIITIIRWMFKGRKEGIMNIIPPAGVSEKDILHASVFGDIITEGLQSGNLDNLNDRLIAAGATEINPGLVMIEKRGIILFRIWAKFILRKGDYGDKRRIGRVRLFKYYLLTVLYLVSPFASLLFEIIRPFRKQKIKKQISLYQSLQ